MDGVRAYLLSVTAGAVLCAIVKSLCSVNGSCGKIVELICGLFLLFTVISPLHNVNLARLPDVLPEIIRSGEDAVEEGKEYAEAARAAIIKSETEAYILSKAAEYGVALSADVTVSDTHPYGPEHVCITGHFSAYLRNQLEQIIETELGIPKEEQQWNP